jgi:hypothetical protein
VVRKLKDTLFEWMAERMPPLRGYELVDSVSDACRAQVEFPNVPVDGARFYARVRGSKQRRDCCFALAVPDATARITIELLEGNSVKRPYVTRGQQWDDPRLDKACAGDEWGCLRVNGVRVEKLPYAVRLGDLQDGVDPMYMSMHGQGNDKTFCFRTGEFNKRQEQSELGYLQETGGRTHGVCVQG